MFFVSFKIYNLYLNENGKILLHSDVKEQISTGVDFGEQIRKVKTNYVSDGYLDGENSRELHYYH